ncbi:hypothetical protein P154DRAFT_576400 [Amniculicola lignicola CBS 123094]|uniref:Uncharacterized protein n=1 Tax=Amniculicola lignicola CBS 123094 TaxID=1392246 RepID=A0A6A5WG83_9PLEO|nr:hypothetical protein P154DRAFT_576400 [Amniculicola lignicola CBS 123094]
MHIGGALQLVVFGGLRSPGSPRLAGADLHVTGRSTLSTTEAEAATASSRCWSGCTTKVASLQHHHCPRPNATAHSRTLTTPLPRTLHGCTPTLPAHSPRGPRICTPHSTSAPSDIDDPRREAHEARGRRPASDPGMQCGWQASG